MRNDDIELSSHVDRCCSIINHPKLAPIFDNGSPTLTDVQKSAPEKPKEPTKEQKPKEVKEPKAEAAPKAPKAPKAAKPKDDDDDDEEPLVPEEPKVKNPLDDLPKSAFNLEEWKRQYSNLDTRKEALPWFYEKYVERRVLWSSAREGENTADSSH